MLSRCKVCLLGDMKTSTNVVRDFISYDKDIIEHIAGVINVSRGEQDQK